MMKHNTTQLKLSILALMLFGLFSTRLYANDLARSNCLFDTIEVGFPSYFYPRNTTTQILSADDGIAYMRSYSNAFQSALFATEAGDFWYAFYGQWERYGTIDDADQAIANGACQSSVQSSPTSVGFCATPPLGYISDGKPLITSHGVVSKNLRWENGKYVKVAFDFQNGNSGKRFYANKPYMCQSAVSQTDCETRIRNEVSTLAKTWSQYGNIDFQFGVPWNKGEIRIRFWDTNGGNSYVGRQALNIANKETMNLGLNHRTTPDTFRRTVIHEFGHAIGFRHEHQSPKVRYTWNVEQIVQGMLSRNSSQDGKWDRQMVIDYVITPLDSNINKTALFVTDFDPHSIMIYSIPSSWVSAADKANPSSCPSTDDPYWCVKQTTDLSELDKRTVAKMYPYVAACTYSISPTTQSFTSSGGTGTVTITTQTGCQWNASSHSGWIRVISGSSGNGNGTISYSVSANSISSSSNNTSSSRISNPRTGIISVEGKALTITQSGVTKPACSYNISPTATQSFSSTGGTGRVNVTTQAGCQWNASSNAGWINIISGSRGNGNGTVSYSVSKNSKSSSTNTSSSNTVSISGTPRTGTITIAGKTLAITQLFGVVITTKPTAPQRMSAEALGSTSIKVSWTDNSNNETGFYIYRWNGSAWLKIGTVGANTTSYTDTGRQGSTTYHYLVAAYNSAGENGYSNYVSATTTMSQSDLGSFCTSGSVNIDNVSRSCTNGNCKSSGVKITCNNDSCQWCDVNNRCEKILYNGITSISGGSINCRNGQCNYSVQNGGSSSSGNFYCRARR